MAPTQTTMIKASMTAYSTAVVPSFRRTMAAMRVSRRDSSIGGSRGWTSDTRGPRLENSDTTIGFESMTDNWVWRTKVITSRTLNCQIKEEENFPILGRADR